MNEQFTYYIPTKVYFGPDQIGHLGEELEKYGKKILLCYGGGSIKRNGLYDKVVKSMKDKDLEIFELSGIEPNPRIDSVRKGAEICRKENIDVVLAVGGGSVIDCSKFIASATFYDGDPWDLLSKHVVTEKCLPIFSVLTAAATGSEMDAGGVISNPETQDKLGGGAPGMLPKVSFLDPTVTYTVSTKQTVCGSADILSHLYEIYFVPEGQSMYMLDRFMEGMMRTVIKYTPIAVKEPDNYEARENLMWASSWAINGFAGAKQQCDWTCHPIEHEVSAIYDITHGLGLAIITPRWMRYVLDKSTAPRFREYGVNVFGIDPEMDTMEAALKSIEMTEDFLFNTLGISSTFTEIGIGDENIPVMAEKACKGGILEGYKPLNKEDIGKILRACL